MVHGTEQMKNKCPIKFISSYQIDSSGEHKSLWTNSSRNTKHNYILNYKGKFLTKILRESTPLSKDWECPRNLRSEFSVLRGGVYFRFFPLTVALKFVFFFG